MEPRAEETNKSVLSPLIKQELTNTFHLQTMKHMSKVMQDQLMKTIKTNIMYMREKTRAQVIRHPYK